MKEVAKETLKEGDYTVSPGEHWVVRRAMGCRITVPKGAKLSVIGGLNCTIIDDGGEIAIIDSQGTAITYRGPEDPDPEDPTIEQDEAELMTLLRIKKEKEKQDLALEERQLELEERQLELEERQLELEERRRRMTSSLCPFCENEAPSDANFCPQCGQKLITQCYKCKKDVRSRGKYCPHCGAKQQEGLE